MAHSALAASSMFTTTSTLFHGHTIAMIHANITTLDGAEIIESLPWYLRLAFPAILSQKGGLSRSVMIQLCVGNQHKMGPRGIRALLIEMHTMRFNVLQLHYLEANFEQLSSRELGGATQSTLHWHSYLLTTMPDFGDFGINIATLACSDWPLSLRSDQLMIHIRYFSRVCRVFVDFIANSTGRLTSILQKLMVFLYLVHYGHAWTLGTFAQKH